MGVYKESNIRRSLASKYADVPEILKQMYKQLGYKVVFIPYASVEERVNLILSAAPANSS